MVEQISTNKRIAKNTFLLYFRMFLIIGVTFYTTRVILNVLGVENYGIYTTIGGIVLLFSFINNALLTTTQRYLNYYYGKNDITATGQYYSVCMFVFVFIGVVISLFSEMAGYLFIHYKMVLPCERIAAAEWTLHISVIINFINIIRSPYHACVVANEKFDFYAYLSIIEVLLKLVIVYILSSIQFDKLIFYNLLLLSVTIVIFLVYKFYCNKKYVESKIQYVTNKVLYKEVILFSGYSLLGNAANVCSQQGISLLLNVFCGVIVNAAIGISNQVSSGVYSFVSNFQTAFNPQLVKLYAQDETWKLVNTILSVSKFSFFLLFILIVPVIIYSTDILKIWLVDIPDYTKIFCILTLIYMLIDTLAAPLWITIQASGHIKKYQIITSIIILLNLPISLFFLNLGWEPTIVFVIRILINLVAYAYRLYFANTIVYIGFSRYCLKVLLPILKVVLSIAVIYYFILSIELNFMLSILILVLIFCLGLSRNEELFIIQLIKRGLKFI